MVEHSKTLHFIPLLANHKWLLWQSTALHRDWCSYHLLLQCSKRLNAVYVSKLKRENAYLFNVNLKSLALALFGQKSSGITTSKGKHLKVPCCNVTLVGIAKNESMYLPEWIYHHLYFGFSNIVVFVNGCTDNTEQLVDLMRHLPVKFVNCDHVFNGKHTAPQVKIYRDYLARNSRAEKGVLFIDIDEFWVPTDLEKSIVDVCSLFPSFDTVSFKWFNKLERNTEFARAVEPVVTLESAKQIKTLFNGRIAPKEMNPHNTLDKGLVQLFEDGTPLQCLNEQNSTVSDTALPRNAYILHRKNRSQYEYIAMLHRGRPLGKNVSAIPILKENRQGFKNPNETIEFSYSSKSYVNYKAFMDKCLLNPCLENYFAEAKICLEKRYKEVMSVFADSEALPSKTRTRLLTGITFEDLRK